MYSLKYFLITFFSFSLHSAIAQTFTPTDAGSKVHFVIKNFGVKVGGDFSGLQGSVTFNPANLSSCHFSVTVKSASVDTDNRAMENHLRKAEFFDVAQFPFLTFTSTRVTTSTIPDRYYMYGNLTIKGVTKPVEFGFSAIKTTTGFDFKGEFELNRRDFGVGGNSFSLSDNLKVILDINVSK